MSTPQYSVLIVDDEKDNLDALKRLLRKSFVVETADSGPEALKVLDQNPNFDCILSDQRMPGMTGSELFERIRNSNNLATRILISGFSDLEAVIDAVNRGHIWKYISKPWEPAELIESLKDAAERSQLQRSLDISRNELSRAALELRAKDWARERLLHILLHEFRSLPQILDSVLSLNKESSSMNDRERFLNRGLDRIKVLRDDIEALLEDEKSLNKAPRVLLDLNQLLIDICAKLNISYQSHSESIPFSASTQSLESGLTHLLEILKKNQNNENIVVHWENLSNDSTLIFLNATVNSAQKILPSFVKQKDTDPSLAWKALLEPFVGHENFEHHSQGLRIETASHIRKLSAQGIRADFITQNNAQQVTLLLKFCL